MGIARLGVGTSTCVASVAAPDASPLRHAVAVPCEPGQGPDAGMLRACLAPCGRSRRCCFSPARARSSTRWPGCASCGWVFGASTAASAAVVAIFVGGLGARRLDLRAAGRPHARPLASTRCSSLVAASAAPRPRGSSRSRALYVAARRHAALGAAGGDPRAPRSSRRSCSAVPTVLMGGTLPGRRARHGGPRRRRSRRRGSRRSTASTRSAPWSAASPRPSPCSRALGHARVRSGSPRASTRSSRASRASRRGGAARSSRERRLPRPATRRGRPRPTRRRPRRRRPAGGSSSRAAAAVGFAFFLMELVWYRMLAPLLGGIGVHVRPRPRRRAARHRRRRAAATRCSSRAAPATLAGFAVVPARGRSRSRCLRARRSPRAAGAVLRPLGPLGFGAARGGWTARPTAIVVLPAALVAGFSSRCSSRCSAAGARASGGDVGLAYAATPSARSPVARRRLRPDAAALGAGVLAARRRCCSSALGLAVVALGRPERAGRRAARRAASRWPPRVVARRLGRRARRRRGGTAASAPGARRADVLALAQSRARLYAPTCAAALAWEGDGVESSVALAAEEPATRSSSTARPTAAPSATPARR